MRTILQMPSSRSLLGLFIISNALLFGFVGNAGALPTNIMARPLAVFQLTNLLYEQKLGAQVSLNSRFEDESGRQVELSQFFNGKPVILALGYYQCPMLCNLVLNGLVESLQNLKLSASKDFEVVFVSIDPKETSALASAKRRTYVKRYARSNAGWHFLTSHSDAAAQLAQEVGFRYAYDPSTRQYAHPSGIVVLTPKGATSRYFLGVQYPDRQLQAALHQAASNQTGAPAPPLLMLCFRWMPFTGRYSGILMTAVRALALTTILGLSCFILFALRGAPRLKLKRGDRTKVPEP